MGLVQPDFEKVLDDWNIEADAIEGHEYLYVFNIIDEIIQVDTVYVSAHTFTVIEGYGGDFTGRPQPCGFDIEVAAVRSRKWKESPTVALLESLTEKGGVICAERCSLSFRAWRQFHVHSPGGRYRAWPKGPASN